MLDIKYRFTWGQIKFSQKYTKLKKYMSLVVGNENLVEKDVPKGFNAHTATNG